MPPLAKFLDAAHAHVEHSDLAQNVLDAGTVPLLVLCIQEPEITLKRISASAMSDICKHTPELAQAVVDAGAVAYLSPLIMHPDSKLKRQARLPCRRIIVHMVHQSRVAGGRTDLSRKCLQAICAVEENMGKICRGSVKE